MNLGTPVSNDSFEHLSNCPAGREKNTRRGCESPLSGVEDWAAEERKAGQEGKIRAGGATCADPGSVTVSGAGVSASDKPILCRRVPLASAKHLLDPHWPLPGPRQESRGQCLRLSPLPSPGFRMRPALARVTTGTLPAHTPFLHQALTLHMSRDSLSAPQVPMVGARVSTTDRVPALYEAHLSSGPLSSARTQGAPRASAPPCLGLHAYSLHWTNLSLLDSW